MSDIHYSLQPAIIGKPGDSNPVGNTQWYRTGFEAKFTSVEVFAKAVAEDGYLWSGSIFKGGERCNDNFAMSDLVALDIDNKIKGETLPKDQMATPVSILQDHPLANGICLIYYTASSTLDHPRFRVVFRLPKPIRDRGQYPLFCHKFMAVSIAKVRGIDPIKDEARVWFGSQCGYQYISRDAVLDLESLELNYTELPSEVRQAAEHDAIRSVSTREELIHLGEIGEDDVFAGDSHTDQTIFKHCLKHLPSWAPDGNGWYQENSWILGAAVHSFGVDLASEVLESAWGQWPRSRPLYQELQQWERNHDNPRRFGSVVEAARTSQTWTEQDQQLLNNLQKQCLPTTASQAKCQEVQSLKAVRELFGVHKVECEDQCELGRLWKTSAIRGTMAL